MANKYTNFIPENIAPKDAKKITVYNANGEFVGSISLGRLKQPTKNKLYSFCALSDVHLTYDTANADFQRALTYAESSCDFTCIAGDLTSAGSDSEMTTYKNIVETYAPTKPVYAIAGNHEAIWGNMTFDRTTPYTGKPLYYTFTKGNDVFIMVGHYGTYQGDGIGWVAGEQFTTEELQWLYETLEANKNKRCFVFTHIFPWGGAGNANGAYHSNNWTSTKGTVFENLMKHYKNTILFHGHSHLKFDLQELDEKANYSSVDGYRSVHIPSLSVPRDIVDGSLSVLYAESEGYIVDVYNDYIILNGRDFIDNDADGNIVPIATYKIDTTLVNIEANTFTDTTGTIIT
jgi:predicted phosphodiesterase